jgi:hypothetical protein
MTRLAQGILWLCLGALAACSADAPVPVTDTQPIVAPGPVQFRAHGDYFEIDRGAGWQKFIVNAVDLAVAKPGFYPGELAAKREDYDRWLAGIAEMGANVIRIYTLHYPVFYQALREWNLGHPDQQLYLLHGIWLDERTDGDYMTDSTALFEDEIRKDIDAIHGNIDIAERFGKASGHYSADASPWLMAWLPGDEMDGELVAASDAKWAGYNQYNGRYLRMKKGGLPLEGWVAHEMDTVLAYEHDRYDVFRPIGWSSWPALDPIHHLTESPNFGQDVVDCNFAQFELIPPYDKGLFASYHVYPFNPEFIIYDPHYNTTLDAFGAVNSYLGYLKDLKSRHQGVPLLVAEYGIPSSQGVAHVNPYAYNHGGYSEAEQADIVYDLYQSCMQAGIAGTVAFEWIDEWFKRTWVTTPTMLPADRGRLWLDVMSPEENFGILSYYPLPGWSKQVDGDASDWNESDFTVSPHGPAGFMQVRLAADPAFLYIYVQLPEDTTPDLQKFPLLFGISTAEGATGNQSLGPLHFGSGQTIQPAGGVGYEAMVVLDGETRELRIDAAYDPMPRINGEKKTGGVPMATTDGQFVLENQLVNNNAQYLAMDVEIDGKQWLPPPKQYHPWGKLKLGDATKDTSANVALGPHGVVEIRLPWHALWVTDPSSRSILWDDPATPGWDVRQTEGIRISAVQMQRSEGDVVVVNWVPFPMMAPVFPDTSARLLASEVFAWPTWDIVPNVVERRKPLFYALKAAFAGTK